MTKQPEQLPSLYIEDLGAVSGGTHACTSTEFGAEGCGPVDPGPKCVVTSTAFGSEGCVPIDQLPQVGDGR
jgi:hypothetical protein